MRFDGVTYDPALDEHRLSKQLGRVYAALASGGWWSLEQLAARANGSEAGVSARIRDLRKPRFGGYEIRTRRAGDGHWLYQMVPRDDLFRNGSA